MFTLSYIACKFLASTVCYSKAFMSGMTLLLIKYYHILNGATIISYSSPISFHPVGCKSILMPKKSFCLLQNFAFLKL